MAPGNKIVCRAEAYRTEEFNAATHQCACDQSFDATAVCSAMIGSSSPKIGQNCEITYVANAPEPTTVTCQ
jgi:hypothetical protein